MNTGWIRVIEWGYILAFVCFGFWGLMWVKDWWQYQKNRDELIRKIRERYR